MIPLSFVLGEMELTGVLVDTEYYKKLAEEYESKIKELEDEFNSYPDVKLLERKQGKPVNFNSPTQMKALFYDLLKLPILKYTKNKNKKNKNAPPNPSTDEETLEKLAEYHPIPKVLMKHRKFSKFLSTYVKPVPDLLYSDGRLHTNYFQQVTVTGRLASSKPNLQNLPKKEPEMAMQIRRGLVATEGYTFIESDLGQIEFRLLANECRDETMLKDISSGLDIHKTIASIAFNVSYDKVTPVIREKAKTIVYSIVYGKGEENLAKETGFTVEQVKAIFGAIYRRYPRVKPYMLSLINRAKTTGEVTNWIGRRRRLADGFKSGVEILMAEAERQAVNSPIQSGAHDILSVATIKIYSELKRRNLKSRLVLTIHDSLVLEVKNEELNEVIKLVKTIMETSPSKKIIVPLIVDIAVGTKLGEMVKLKKEDLEKILNGKI
jgi:DNA polymerase-1